MNNPLHRECQGLDTKNCRNRMFLNLLSTLLGPLGVKNDLGLERFRTGGPGGVLFLRAATARYDELCI